MIHFPIHCKLGSVLLGIAFVLGTALLAHASGVSWTMAVVPDTQNYFGGSLSVYNAQMQWIADNKDSRNILLVAGQGDITGTNSARQWTNAVSAHTPLMDEVPYILITGNHDYNYDSEDNLIRDSTLLNDYFSLSDSSLNSTMTVERIPGRLENSYSTFETPDGRKMLVFALEWETRPEVVAWADSIAGLPQFADHTAVLLTHAYLREGGLYPDGTKNVFRSAAHGDPIWNDLLSQHENFELVMNGHFLDNADSDFYGPLTTGYQTSVGDNGNLVHEIVFNAQEQANGGNGYLRLLEFLEDGKTVQVRTYSPTLDVWATNTENEFQFQLSFEPSADFNDDGITDHKDYTLWNLYNNKPHFDVNGDNMVNSADFLQWQRSVTSEIEFVDSPANLNQQGPVDTEDITPWENSYALDDMADINNDGNSDGTDFLLWQNEYTLFDTSDINHDRLVDLDDLDSFDTSYGFEGIMADANLDALNNGEDFLIWQRQFGETTSFLASSMAVPEPTTTTLSLLTVLAICSPRMALRLLP